MREERIRVNQSASIDAMQAQPSVTSTFRPRHHEASTQPKVDDDPSVDDVLSRFYWGLGAMACYAIASVIGVASERMVALGVRMSKRSLYSGDQR